ncbi:hypothetical protein M2447_002368 [Ereboglobus sp. PH5-10]|uniref:hypothetical protein n=1 Tax=Ereboglobus sp. PH5-10 TaxID=2940629 RepID=UPI00240507B6|nr:hypothetical protein [Ereboglobus sp. PH5-10]MDF9828250.1 hypothetical protein [Ereboglobus sp. PH5-10]
MKVQICKSVCFIFFILLLSSSMYSNDVSITIEVASDPLRYRIKIKSNAKKPIEFDESAFNPPRWGIAPYGTTIVIRDGSDKYIYLGENGEYSSISVGYELFGKPSDEWRLLNPNQIWESEWLSILDVTYDIKSVVTEKDPKKWKDFKILFRIRINKKSPMLVRGDSDWISTDKISLEEVMNPESKTIFQLREERKKQEPKKSEPSKPTIANDVSEPTSQPKALDVPTGSSAHAISKKTR